MTWPLPVCRPLWSVHYILMKTSGKKEQTTIRKWWFVEMDGSLRWAIHREMIVHNIFVCINSLLIQNDTSTFSPLHPEAGCDEKPISILETGTRISFFQSHVRDENEIFFLSISCFETRTRISFFNLGLRDENENRDWDNSRENFRELHLLLVYWLIFSKKCC